MTFRTFSKAREHLQAKFRHASKRIHTKKWQGTDISLRPDMVSHELLNETMQVELWGIEDLDHWRRDIEPNLPWADDHFLERVSGAPLNPGVQWANWPWASSADKHRTVQELGPRIPAINWAYLGGLLDGEGTIYWRKNALPRWQGVIRIYQKDRAVLDYLIGIFKVGKIVTRGEGEWETVLPDGTAIDNPMSYWQINAFNEVKWLLHGLTRFLHVKANRAEEARRILENAPAETGTPRKLVWDQEWPPRFNHTYMTRLWPRRLDSGSVLYGHEGEYGDLRTLVDMLAWEPDTRQAYIPLYFPEDTGLEGRKPCTLGYQFIMRENQLHIYYPLRSCDFVRHWADDCYLAVRLLLWVLDECRQCNPKDWEGIKPGSYTMHCTSLHVFANDAIQMGIQR